MRILDIKAELLRILSFPSPPSQVLEPRFLRQYYLGYFKNIFEKWGYKVQRNYSVFLETNEEASIDLVASKLNSYVGVEISGGKYVSPKSIDKFKVLKLDFLVYIVKDGKVEDNYDHFLDTNWDKYHDVFFMSIDYLQISSLKEIMMRAKAQKEKFDIKQKKMEEKYGDHRFAQARKQDILARLQATEKKKDVSQVKTKDTYEKTSEKSPRMKKKISGTGFAVISKEKHERPPRIVKKVSRAHLVERLEQNRERKAKKKCEL